MPDLPELDTAEIAVESRRRALDVCGEHGFFAVAVLERLEPERWALEWHLPWWLSGHLGVPRDIAQQLVVSNVLGLAAIRLRDDLHDTDVQPQDALVATDVAAALHDAALSPYRALFTPGSPIWAEIALRMAEWQSATLDDATSQPPHDGEGVARHLARRGAPLKIATRAVCLLAGRIDFYEPLSRCLDHVLGAMTLFDHLCDWPEDVAAGRWNAFAGGRARPDVLVDLMTSDSMATYAGRIAVELDHASALAEDLQFGALGAHIARTRTQIDAHAAQLEEHYRDVSESAVALVFGSRAV